jgi:plastocyanin
MRLGDRADPSARRARNQGMQTSATVTKISGVLVTLALAVPLAACGSTSSGTSTAKTKAAGASSSAAAPAVRRLKVSISGYAYQPVTVTAGVGSRITFTNHDATAHTATSNKPAFDTGTLKPGQSGTVTLKKPGTYTFYCQFHAFMHGTVVVK